MKMNAMATTFKFSLTFFSLRHALLKAHKGSSIATTTNEAYGMIDHSIATTTNEAYGMIKLEQMDEHVYEVIDACGGTNPHLTDGTNKNPCLSPFNWLLPTIPPIVGPLTSENVGVARDGEEEAVYDTIP